ncbi:unnamed protein product [Leptidea sinapis]|uniref:DNA primase large subunit C-terminal domain-containing protein n=1 Tax=Leptidea sinapis TaxID=189913 RepID=A0A5E4QA40_9NEOP|nr:unnamed protein product [Leptidea sinapis]
MLEIIVLKRLEHLNGILRNCDIEYNEYTIDGSIYDNIGHFMLCAASLLEQNDELFTFILETEIALFQSRISLLSAYDLRRFAKKLLKYIRKTDIDLDFLKPLQVLCQHLNLRQITQHICADCNAKCSTYNFRIKFKFCLDFVAKRQVEIKNGYAVISCSIWKDYLYNLFSFNLKNRLFKTRLNSIQWDPRINELSKKIKNMVACKNICEKNMVLSNEIDNLSVYFPPCMLNLHQQLRTHHRLSHQHRFNYSLFLKDIGMPIDEAVKFWKTEYLNMPNSHSCCHDWNTNEKKYVYGIRHMYGLEGSKRNYTSRNCQVLQNLENSCSEGGCPFKCFSDEKMQQLLKLNKSDTSLSQIKDLRKMEEYAKACQVFLKRNSDSDVMILNFSPLKYYNIALRK